MSQLGNRFVPALEPLDQRVNPGSTGSEYIGTTIGQYGWVLPAPDDSKETIATDGATESAPRVNTFTVTFGGRL